MLLEMLGNGNKNLIKCNFKMKIIGKLFVFFFTVSVFSQNTYLHCGKLIDTKSGKVLTEKTIVVSGKNVVSVIDGYVKPDK